MLVMRRGAFWFEYREPQALGRENDMRLTDPRTASGRDDETRRRDDAQATRQAVANRILKRDDSNAGSPALRLARGETGASVSGSPLVYRRSAKADRTAVATTRTASNSTPSRKSIQSTSLTVPELRLL